MKAIITAGEYEAYKLLHDGRCSTDVDLEAFRQSGDAIIALAQRIKNERISAILDTIGALTSL